ncbi:Uncharacterised protein [Mycobacteroides abscessus subsp. abscessus]|nr:Uncharacterised protein [Mycobacteroides abscessus subsp. abscessus]
MRRPPKKAGRAEGRRRRHRICQRDARLSRKKSSRPGSTLRSPSTVLLMMGNTATMVAQKVSASVVFWIQMMISGAMATIGVTCNNTA